MPDANPFEEFAKEALQQASKAKSEQEKLALNELALAWENAALASDRVFGSSWYFPWYGRPH
jgi:ABC-type molybdate transport system substrate-binding protein